MGVYFPNLKIPTRCEDCNELDHEYDFGCELMPCTRFDSFQEQYALCPLKRLMRMYAGLERPEHGDLIDSAAFACISYKGTEGLPDTFDYGVLWMLDKIDNSPVIIPATEEAK